MNKRINIGLLAHVDAGKTTLTEQMLYISGAIRRAGSVDHGDAHTDNLPVERERGISVKACSAGFSYLGADISLIDTPGHADFSGEIERSLRALDNAVLILSAVEGVQPQTEMIWKALQALAIPTLFFINKIDRIGADTEKVIHQVITRLGVKPLALTSNLALADGYDVYEPDLLEALAENDLNFMEAYLSDADNPRAVLAKDEIINVLRGQYAERKIFPVVTGSALRGVNVEALMKLIVSVCKTADTNALGELSALVYRIEHHPSLGKVAHMRLFGGQLKIRGEVRNTSKNINEKVSQIKKYNGVKLTDATSLSAGESGVVCGLSESGIGDIYGNEDRVPGGFNLTQPLISVRVFPKDESQYPALLSATKELFAEDPLLDMANKSPLRTEGPKDTTYARRDNTPFLEQRDVLLSVTGLIQIEILQYIYQTRFGLKVDFGSPTVIYKETPSKTAEGFEAYTMPKPCWAVIRFLIEPLPEGSGVVYQSIIGPDTLPLRYQAQIEQALPDALRQGPKGWEVTDVKITLVDGESHVYHTHPLDFILATPMALLNGLVNAGTDLLEPYLSFTLTVPETLSGKMLGEITVMRGRYDETSITDGVFTVKGVYPLASGMDFPQKMAMLTSGRGVLSARFSHYEKCPPGFSVEQPYRGISPLDRAKYILHIRGAL